jgi:hypothetical protein
VIRRPCDRRAAAGGTAASRLASRAHRRSVVGESSGGRA